MFNVLIVKDNITEGNENFHLAINSSTLPDGVTVDSTSDSDSEVTVVINDNGKCVCLCVIVYHLHAPWKQRLYKICDICKIYRAASKICEYTVGSYLLLVA